MKKVYITIIFLIITVIHVVASSNHTIIIDGVNSGWATDEQFTNCSSADNAYFTWDAEYIYIGISADEADYDNMTTFIYFDSDPTGSNGSANAYAWGDYITTPFSADYAIALKNGLNNPDDYIQFMQYNNTNTTWEQAYTVTNALFILNGADTVVKFAIGTDYREFKINRSYIGSPDAIKTCMFTEQQWDSYWRYFVWPSDGWTDAGRTSGQAIPNYYGFFLEPGISPNRAPYYDASFNLWTGAAKSTSWDNAGNWGNGVPDGNTLAKLPSTATVIVDAAGAECDDILMNTGATLTINTNGTLTSNGGIYNYTGYTGLVVESSLAGNGSLIYHKFSNTMLTAQCYTTEGRWHSFSAPVSGLVSMDLYLNASPEVWLAGYDEATRDYNFISSFTKPLGDLNGWMLWVGGTVSNTYYFEGLGRESVQGSTDNLVRSATGGDYGFNYVGNPFTSAIDWDASSGWTKTNINTAIYIRNGGSWESYVGGTGTKNGSRYIAMNQGFFVQVTSGFSNGTLTASRDVCTHNDVGYLKTTNTIDSLVRMQLTQLEDTDETVIRFHTDATEEFDGQFDAHKFFSYSENQPLIYSTTGATMSINSLPHSVQEVDIDVIGIDGINMTISATEINSFNNVYLKDKSTGIVTNLAVDDYTFNYDSSYTNRFSIYFKNTYIEEVTNNEIPFYAYSLNNNINLRFDDNDIYNVSIINLLGQEVFSSENVVSHITIPYIVHGYYLINVSSGYRNSVKKIIVK